MELRGDRRIILHCIDSLALGGAESLLKNTLPLLTDYDHIVCYLHRPDTLIQDLKSYPVYCLNYNSKSSFFNSARTLRQIIRQNKVSIVHAHLLYSTFVARFAGSKGVKLFFTLHNLMSKDAFEVNRFSLWAERLTYKKSQTIIGVSKEVLTDYDKWVGIKGKSFVLYNYVPDKFFELKADSEKDVISELKLVAVGNLRRQKNYSALLNAFSLLKDFPISLDIYGTGDLENELLAKIKKERLNVRLKGRAEDVSKVLPSYDAYIMPSLFEGFGIAPMEAMAAGMPIILSNLNVFKEIAEDVPVYFEPTDPLSIADAIKYVYNNWRNVSLNTDKGRTIVKRKASKQIYLKKLTEIYAS